MNTFAHLIGQSAVLLVIFMSVFFLYSMYKKRNDVVDVAWGLGFIFITLAAIFSQLYSGGYSLADFAYYNPRAMLIAVLVCVWGARISLHIYHRNKGKAEDFRYKNVREEWGRLFLLRSYFQVFLLQGLLILAISLPVLGSISVNGFEGFPGTLSYLTIAGAVIWLVGFCFEAVSDFQLSKFLKDPSNQGKVMTSKLWKHSRHPNYFGEVTLWWGIYIASLPFFFWNVTLIGPLVITFMILKITGIPVIEKRFEGHPEFEAYKKQTSPFLPLPQKKA